MSYLVNSKNIAPVAYGFFESNGTSSHLYNCTTTSSNNYYEVNLISGTYTHIVPISSCEASNGLVAINSKSNNKVVFRTHYSAGQNSGATMPFNFVIFGYN
jgi:hypothetical protein